MRWCRVPMSDADPRQDAQIVALETKVGENTRAIGELSTGQKLLDARFDMQDKTLERIESGTASFGDAMKEQLVAMREAETADKVAERAASAAWWSSAWKVIGSVVGGIVTLGGLLLGGGYVAVQSADSAEIGPQVEQLKPDLREY